VFRTHPDIHTARMTFNHQPSIGWQVCISLHFNLYSTQPTTSFMRIRSLAFGL